MGARTSGREAALQMLFAFDVGQTDADDVETLVENYWRELPGHVDGREFANELVRGVVGKLGEIDAQITHASTHWRLERMARVDRNVLRLGVHQLASMPDVPRPVVIDEAVELAKQFGGEGSGLFVNGVLDRIADDLKR